MVLSSQLALLEHDSSRKGPCPNHFCREPTMHRTTRLKVKDINQLFTCVLCDGYIIDATTIVECLHSFCRTCIVRYLENSRYCPLCEVQVHKTKPLQSLKTDRPLQDVIYKLVPGLYRNEMQRRQDFYAKRPEEAAILSSEERGEGMVERCFFAPDESISVTLVYLQGSEDKSIIDDDDSNSNSSSLSNTIKTVYLNCPAAVTVTHLKKLIRCKFRLPTHYQKCLSDYEAFSNFFEGELF
ncbi:polycomb complex protein BMI-1-B [Caerostris darwini]|uniref:Polycomb complex protein BMI-1-B n=1 Tax=Caerostris darwini TaxID=1538125 RepID=A0AAV4UAA0_9ARAC|nr:polycomb complex protein BMI-1-B [Caerostris darwini]